MSVERITSSTYFGYIQSTKDALLVFEAVRQNRLPKINRRLREEERLNLIRSGAVFVFDEAESGVKRWTDGLYWSPSRILNNFLVYRQIEKKPGPSSEDPKSKTKEHIRFSASDGAPQVPVEGAYTPQASSMLDEAGPSTRTATHLLGPVPGLHPQPEPAASSGTKEGNDPERSLVGSLTNSFPFRRNGLCKKTISFPVGKSHQHLISYYSIEDVLLGRLRTPSSLPELDSLVISKELLVKSNFRNPPQIEKDQDGIERYRGEPVETPHNARRKSGVSGSGDEQPFSPDGRSLGGGQSGSSGSSGRMNAPYSPVSATGMTGPVDEFRGGGGGHMHPQHLAYGHHPQSFQFQNFDSPLSGPPGGGLIGSAGGSGSNGAAGGGGGGAAVEHFGNRRRVVSDAPSRLGQLRTGQTRYEPYPSSSLHSSESGHAGGPQMGGSIGHPGSLDSHMSSPATRRDMGLMGSSSSNNNAGGPLGGGGSPADSRPQSARFYGEQAPQNGFGPGNGGGGGGGSSSNWRDAGYVPITPNAGSVNSSTAQSPRDFSYGAPLPPPLGPGPMPSTVSPTEYFQPNRGGGGPHDVAPFYPPPPMQTHPGSHIHSRSQTRGTDGSVEGGNNMGGGGQVQQPAGQASATGAPGLGPPGPSGGSGGAPGMTIQGMISGQNASSSNLAEHPNRLQGGGGAGPSSGGNGLGPGYGMYMGGGGSAGGADHRTQSGSSSSGGPPGGGFGWSSSQSGYIGQSSSAGGAGGGGSGSGPGDSGSMAPNGPDLGWNNSSISDRSMSSEISGSRSEGPTSTSAPYYPSMGPPWPASASDVSPGALGMMSLSHHGPLSVSSSSTSTTFRAPGPTPDWRSAAQSAHHAHRSNSMSSDLSAPGGYQQGGNGNGAFGLRSPLATVVREGPSGGLERVVLRRPPSNG